MKSRKCIILILLCFVLMSCAWGQVKDQFAYTTYGALKTSLSSYKVINGVFTDLRSVNQVSDSAWIQYSKLANAFLDGHIKSDKAMSAYKNGVATQGQVEAAVGLLNIALRELTDYYLKQIPTDKQKPLIQ